MSKKTKNNKLRKLKQKHDNKVSEIQKMEDEIVNKVFDNYINEKDRIQLIEDARTFHYSETKILNVEKLFNNFNTDTIEYNTAIDIIEMETHIYDHYQKEGVFSKISNIVISEDEQ